jgi:hypothetical protein
MFNDKYGLTQAVLEGRKTMTRRIIGEMIGRKYKKLPQVLKDCNDGGSFYVFKDADDFEPIILYPKYEVGKVVAVAQSYKDVIYTGGLPHLLVAEPGWTNKMFVRADLMPNQIRITNVRVERLQDISDEDCIREGIVKALGLYGCEGLCERGDQLYFNTPRDAFAALIDKISGKDTWDSNPWVFVYEFELLK